jgi:hypothetical protein
MLLVAVFVLTNTVSADGSIGGVYQASLRLAEQSYAGSTKTSIEELKDGIKGLVKAQSASNPPASESRPVDEGQNHERNGQPTGSGQKGQ